MGHRDFYGVVTGGNGAVGKAVTLCAQHDGELRLGGKSAVVNAYGAVAQSHGKES